MLNNYVEQLGTCEEIPPQQTVTAMPPPQPSIPLSIPRDLSVQIVGSDAGKEKRFRPTATMTKNVTAEEMSSVEQLTQPFLKDEIKRCHHDRSHKTSSADVTATPEQAVVLKKMCVAHAVHLETRWNRKNQDPRNHRSKQRLDQARNVIRQINRELGLGDDDGRSVGQYRRDVVEQLQRANSGILDLIRRAKKSIDANGQQPINPTAVQRWEQLHDHIDVCVSDPYDEENAS